MQSSTGQYSTQAGEPAHPVQHSVITANSFGFFFRGVNSPLDLGSNLSSSGTIPAGFRESASAGMARLYRGGRDFHPHEVGWAWVERHHPEDTAHSAGRAILRTASETRRAKKSVSFWPASAILSALPGQRPLRF